MPDEQLGTVITPTPKPVTRGESPTAKPTTLPKGDREGRGGATRTDN